MQKRVSVDDLRPGMHIVEMCGSWIDHPFWRSKFTLAEADIQRLRDSNVQEVVIDVVKGRDVDGPADDTGDGEILTPPRVATAAVAAPPAPAPAPAAERTTPDHVPFDEELAHAEKLYRNAKPQLVSMFQEARLGKAIDAGRAAALADEIGQSVTRNPDAFISLARLKTSDEYTFMHSVAVCALMTALARQLGLDDETTHKAGLGGLMHDVGKAKVAIEILNKPGALTDAEFAHVRKHPELGHTILLEGNTPHADVLDIVLHHHEKMDGSGYPHRLRGEQISVLARMGAICDVYDAITSNRPYKAGWTPAESIRKMASWCGGHFDEPMFQAFVKSIGIYPVGSLVKMESGRLAIVIEQNSSSLLMPVVKVFFSTRSGLHMKPERLDLSSKASLDRIVGYEDPATWGFTHLDRLWTSNGT